MRHSRITGLGGAAVTWIGENEVCGNATDCCILDTGPALVMAFCLPSRRTDFTFTG